VASLGRPPAGRRVGVLQVRAFALIPLGDCLRQAFRMPDVSAAAYGLRCALRLLGRFPRETLVHRAYLS